MKRAVLLFCLLLLLPATGVLVVRAQEGGGYDLSWWTVYGGSDTLSGTGPAGTYTLDGTAGQPETGVLEGGDYALAGGFWGGALAVRYRVYLPLLWRDF